MQLWSLVLLGALVVQQQQAAQGLLGGLCTRTPRLDVGAHFALSATSALSSNSKPVSLPGLVNEAGTVEEILALASSGALTLPGEERLHWEKQLVHQRKRQRGATAALKRLSKMLVGATPTAEKRRLGIVQTSTELARFVVAALHPLQPELAAVGSMEDFSSYCEALRSLALLHTATHPSAPPALPPATRQQVMDACGRLGAFLSSKAGQAASESVVDGLYCSAHRLLATPADQHSQQRQHSQQSQQGEGREGAALDAITSARAALRLPFRLLPDLTRGRASLAELTAQVPFTQSLLVTRDGKRVTERRLTCWMAEPGVGGLAYSGKIMSPSPFVPCIAALRDAIEASTGVRYDCCLINLYPDGDCACAYHVDPDLGTVFSRDSVIVSVGESRRFVLRRMRPPEAPAASPDADVLLYHVHDGDVFQMSQDCQERFQHAVLKAEGPHNEGARASVVFKLTMPLGGGRRGHGIPAAASATTAPTAAAANVGRKRK